MAEYEIRFVRPDNSYAKKVLLREFNSKSEAWTFVVEHYAQRATEVWSDNQLVFRRVSPAHEARLRGAYPCPRACRFPAISIYELEEIETESGEISYSEFELLGQLSVSVFEALADEMSNHQVWMRAASHPEAPPSARQQLTFAFTVHRRAPNDWYGFANASLLSRIADGPDVLGDLIDAVASCVSLSLAKLGVRPPEFERVNPGPIVSIGLYLHSSVWVPWNAQIPSEPV